MYLRFSQIGKIRPEIKLVKWYLCICLFLLFLLFHWGEFLSRIEFGTDAWYLLVVLEFVMIRCVISTVSTSKITKTSHKSNFQNSTNILVTAEILRNVQIISYKNLTKFVIVMPTRYIMSSEINKELSFVRSYWFFWENFVRNLNKISSKRFILVSINWVMRKWIWVAILVHIDCGFESGQMVILAEKLRILIHAG